MAFSLSRNAKLFVSTVKSGWTAADTNQIEVLDGFSFPSNTTTQEVTVSEAGTDPIRGQQVFTTSMDPVDWSFSSYVRPYTDAQLSEVSAPEKILLGAMSSADGAGVTGAVASLTTEFSGSNKNQIQKVQLYFFLGGQEWYHVEDAVVNQAEFDFGIDQIAMIAWSGQANQVTKIAEPAFYAGTVADPSLAYTPSTAGYMGMPVSTVAGFLQNKLTTVEAINLGNELKANASDGDTDGTTSFVGSGFTADMVGDYIEVTDGGADNVPLGFYRINAYSSATNVTIDTALTASVGADVQYRVLKAYDVALTGGNLTITNNITYLTPESLGVINRPIDHFTGTRGVSGSMTMYLKTGAQDSGTANLFKDLADNAVASDAKITQNFRLVFHVGGAKTAASRIDFVLAHCHIVIPTINIEDVVAVNVDYTGLPHNGTDFDLESTNEIEIVYYD